MKKLHGFKRVIALILICVLLFSLISAVMVSAFAQSEPTGESATEPTSQPEDAEEEEGGLNWKVIILSILALIAIHFFTFRFMLKK